MTGVIVWSCLLGGSIAVGWVCARSFTGLRGAVLSGAIPWLLLLACLLVNEYLLPYAGGGASMWPIAQLLGGTIAAATGFATYRILERRR